MSLLLWSLFILAQPLHAEMADSVSTPVTPTPSILEQSKFNQMAYLDPEILNKMDSRRVAEMIVERLHQICDRRRNPLNKPPNYNSEILMLVPKQVIPSIVKYGFKNQHETMTTGGSPCRECRLHSESAHVSLGLPYSHKTRNLLPKYAMHVFTDQRRGQFKLPDAYYGDVIFKFKPEVQRRATWHPTDSLGHRTNLRTHKNGAYKGLECRIYCESQIWGELDLSDIESVRIPATMELTEDLKGLGVPVFQYQHKLSSHYGSLGDIEFKVNPIFTPKAPPPQPLVTPDRARLTDLLKVSTHKAEEEILKSQILSRLSTRELIKAFHDPPQEPFRVRFDEVKTRFLAELVNRSADADAQRLFRQILAKGDKADRFAALAGLRNLPWSELKPLLLTHAPNSGEAFRHPYGTFVAYLIASHKQDPEIANWLSTSSLPHWIKNFNQGNGCDTEDYD